MSKFKVGDKVRIVRIQDGRRPDQSYIGKEFVISGGGEDYDGEPAWHGGDGSASKPWRWKESELELIPSGPVRTVTRREIIPGVYDELEVGEARGNMVFLRLSDNPDNFYNSEEIRLIASRLNEIADALEQ